MKEQLATLVELQRLDDAMRETRKARADLAKLQKDNALNIDLFDTMLTDRSASIEEVRTFCGVKEAELKATEDDIRRARARLPTITSQRELTALNKELESGRHRNQKRTEELLKLMQQLEEAETDHTQKKETRDDLARQMGELEERLKARLKTKEGAADAISSQREALRDKLPRPLVSRYDRIGRAREGWAVADVPEGRCAACNIQPPPQTYIRLQRGETMENCANCQRMLVIYNTIS